MIKFLISFLFSIPIFSQQALLGTRALQAGHSMPNFPVYTLDDQRSLLHDSLSSFESDKYVLLNFTSSNCKPCKQEVPELLKIKQEHPGLELWFIFVGDQNDAIDAKVKELKIPPTSRLLKDPLEASLRRLNVTAVPMTYLLGKEKVIIASSIGFTPESFLDFKNKVKSIVK